MKKISLIADESSLRDRLTVDVTFGIRTADMIDRSVQRISMYQALDTVKIDTSEAVKNLVSMNFRLS